MDDGSGMKQCARGLRLRPAVRAAEIAKVEGETGQDGVRGSCPVRGPRSCRGLLPGVTSMAAPKLDPRFQPVHRVAVRASGRAVPGHVQKYPGMLVPERHLGIRAERGQVGCVQFDGGCVKGGLVHDAVLDGDVPMILPLPLPGARPERQISGRRNHGLRAMKPCAPDRAPAGANAAVTVWIGPRYSCSLLCSRPGPPTPISSRRCPAAAATAPVPRPLRMPPAHAAPVPAGRRSGAARAAAVDSADRHRR